VVTKNPLDAGNALADSAQAMRKESKSSVEYGAGEIPDISLS